MNVIGMILERRGCLPENLPSVKDTAQLSGEASKGGESDLMWHLFHMESGTR